MARSAPKASACSSSSTAKPSTRPRPTDASSAASACYLGIDEAGYGPHLGPLVVAGVALRGPATLCEQDWWEVLEGIVTRAEGRKGSNAASSGWVIDDSKRVLARRDGHRQLSKTLHAVFQSLAVPHFPLALLFRALDLDGDRRLVGEHWFEAADSTAGDASPLEEASAEVSVGPSGLIPQLDARGISIERVRFRAVFPREFNDTFTNLPTKADVESAQILRLLGDLLKTVPSDMDSCHIWLDRLGGRRHYRLLVEEAAGECFPSTLEESPSQSRYRFHRGRQTVDIGFHVKGDQRHLPVALASMIAKYVRERCMAGLNRYWQRRLPGLAPTAGYSVDATRFRDQIEPVRRSSRVTLDELWRCR